MMLAYVVAVIISGFGVALGAGDTGPGAQISSATFNSILSHEILHLILPFLVTCVISLVLLISLRRANASQTSKLNS